MGLGRGGGDVTIIWSFILANLPQLLINYVIVRANNYKVALLIRFRFHTPEGTLATTIASARQRQRLKTIGSMRKNTNATPTNLVPG